MCRNMQRVLQKQQKNEKENLSGDTAHCCVSEGAAQPQVFCVAKFQNSVLVIILHLRGRVLESTQGTHRIVIVI